MHIKEISLLEAKGARLVFRVHCSKGTYVRTLAADLGTALGGGAHLRTLRRTRVGPYRLDEACTLDDLVAAMVEYYQS